MSFNIIEDFLTEGDEYFMTSISTSAEGVEISIPMAQVNIKDNDGRFICLITQGSRFNYVPLHLPRT